MHREKIMAMTKIFLALLIVWTVPTFAGELPPPGQIPPAPPSLSPHEDLLHRCTTSDGDYVISNLFRRGIETHVCPALRCQNTR